MNAAETEALILIGLSQFINKIENPSWGPIILYDTNLQIENVNCIEYISIQIGNKIKISWEGPPF